MKFSHVHKDLYGNEESKVEMTLPQDVDLDEVLQSFTDFLRAASYMIPYEWTLDFIKEDEEDEEMTLHDSDSMTLSVHFDDRIDL